MAFGSFACAAYLLPGQLPVAAAYPAGREGLIDDAPFERQAVYPAVGGHLVARGHQPAAGHEARPDARAERQRHYAFGAIRDPAEAFAQREGRRVVDVAELLRAALPQQRVERRRDVEPVDALELPHAPDQRNAPLVVERPGEGEACAPDASDARCRGRAPDVRGPGPGDRAGPGRRVDFVRVRFPAQLPRGEVYHRRADMAAADVHAQGVAIMCRLCHDGIFFVVICSAGCWAPRRGSPAACRRRPLRRREAVRSARVCRPVPANRYSNSPACCPSFRSRTPCPCSNRG